MASTLKRLYDDGKIGQTELDDAVSRGWITQAEADAITA